MALPPGTKLGPYEILAPLGAGGMGEVYRAKDTRLERTVAIKILPAQFTTDPVSKQRFEREAKTVSNLNHPNICVLYDIGHQDTVDYIVMECVEGETLAVRLEKGPLPLEQVLKYGAQIADALDKAHRSGVVHRDLKPGNIMLTVTGAKLLDFGLAKEAAPLASHATLTAAIPSSPLTERGTVVGTFQYMSPEQVEGKELDGRSDIFSLGAVLYEMVTGKRAFEGKTQLSVASAILEREPTPLSTAKPLTPPALDYAIRRCLAKDPEDRWQSGRDLAGQLKWIAEGGSQTGAPIIGHRRANWRERAIWVLAALLAIAVVLLGHAYLNQPPSRGTALRLSILPPPNSSFLFGTGAGSQAISPDGLRLVFSAKEITGNISLWIRPLNSLTNQELPGTENGLFPFWSPDGLWIGFFAQGKLKKVSFSGGTVEEICAATSGRGGTWNDKGEIVFASDIDSPLFRVSANGGVPVQVTQFDSALGETTHRWPEFLPDGDHFLYLARQVADNRSAAIYVGSLSSPVRKKIFDQLTEAHYAPGYLLFVRNNVLLAQPFDAKKLSLEGEAVSIAGGVAVEPGRLRAGFDVSQTGELIYGNGDAESDSELLDVDRSGKHISTIPTEGIVNAVRLSPDGQKLAVVEVVPMGSSSAIWIYDVRLNTRVRFTFGAGMMGGPTWSPDGSQIAFYAPNNGNFNIFVKPTTGAEEEKLLRVSVDDERPQSFSPDGRFLAIDRRTAARLGSPEVAILDLKADGKVTSFLSAPYSNSNGQISPDGDWLAFTSMESGHSEVYVKSFPDAKGKWQVSSGGGVSPRWRRDGRELYFATPDGILMAAETTMSVNSFVLGALTRLQNPRVAMVQLEGQFTVFPDGQRFILPAIKPGLMHAPLTLVENWPAELKK